MDDFPDCNGGLLSVANLLVCRARYLVCLFDCSPALPIQNKGMESALGRLERCRDGISKTVRGAPECDSNPPCIPRCNSKSVVGLLALRGVGPRRAGRRRTPDGFNQTRKAFAFAKLTDPTATPYPRAGGGKPKTNSGIG